MPGLAPGSNTYRDNFKLVLRRESAHANYLWQADNAELHMMILDETGGCLSAAPPPSHRTPRTQTNATGCRPAIEPCPNCAQQNQPPETLRAVCGAAVEK